MDRGVGRAGTRDGSTRSLHVTRDELEARWFVLTRETMPSLAGSRNWPVRFDHCFQRILLDNASGGKWSDTIPAPAYRNAPSEVLERALSLAEATIAGELDLAVLNNQSLDWRGKRKRPGL